MASHIGPNSRRFTKQGGIVSPVALTDRLFFTIKGAGVVTPKNPEGYGTWLGDLNHLKTYIVKKLVVDDIGSIITIKPDSGLLGTGTEDDPIRIDKEWLLDNYLPTDFMPISQVGNSTDFTLPISGSYFSVTYPYNSNRRLQHSAFVERNGELRILTHKTNGEEIRVTYSFWPNAANANTCTNTDIAYNPPGLLTSEFIGGVFTASANAMVVEIWENGTFKEWAFVTLNGTFNHEFHTLLRMGRSLENVLGPDALRTSRWCNVCAVIANGKKYLVFGRSSGVYGFHGSADVYRVDDNTGLLTQIKGWTTINSAGDVKAGLDHIASYSEFYSHDLNNKDALFLITDDRIGSISSQAGGESNNYFITLGPIDSQGRVGLLMQYYGSASARLMPSTSLRNTETLAIDFEKRIASAAFVGKRDQRWRVKLRDDESWWEADGRIYGANAFSTAHYYATSMWTVLLNYGLKVTMSSSLDISAKPNVYVFRNGTNNGVSDSMNTDLWTPSGSLLRQLDLQPPTAIFSGYTGRVMFDKLHQTNHGASPYLSLGPTDSRYGLLRGNKTDYVYRVLDNTTLDGSFVEIPGFKLNAERGVVPNGRYWNSINSFVNGSSYGYHNAVFGSTDVPVTGREDKFAFFNNDLSPGDTRWDWTETLRTKMTNYVRAITVPNGDPTYTKLYSWMYSVIPPFPGISPDLACVTVMVSYVDPSLPELDFENTKLSPYFKFLAMCPCKYTKDTDGNYTLTDVDVSSVLNGQVLSGIGTIRWGTDSGRRYTSSAWRMNSDNTVDVIHMGGHDLQNVTGNNSNGATVQCIGTWNRTTGEKVIAFRNGSLGIPSYSPKVGFGSVFNTTGLGAFYSFIPLNDELKYVEEGRVILGTARPPAGFAFTVSAPIPILLDGKPYEIGIQTYDLSTLFPDPKLKKFYVTAKLVTGEIKLDITLSPPVQDSNTSFYMGFITTTDSEISEINTLPIVRWESYRPSQIPIGSAIPVSIGLPHNQEPTEWPPKDIRDFYIDNKFPDRYHETAVDGHHILHPIELYDVVSSRLPEPPLGAESTVNVTVMSDVAIIGGLDPLI